MSNPIRYVENQAELESLAHQQLKARIVSNDLKQAQKNYWSNTDHGRAILKGNAGDGKDHMELLINEIREFMVSEANKKRGTKSDGYWPMVWFCEAVNAIQQDHPSYAGGGEPEAILALMTIKCIVDGFCLHRKPCAQCIDAAEVTPAV